MPSPATHYRRRAVLSNRYNGKTTFSLLTQTRKSKSICHHMSINGENIFQLDPSAAVTNEQRVMGSIGKSLSPGCSLFYNEPEDYHRRLIILSHCSRLNRFIYRCFSFSDPTESNPTVSTTTTDYFIPPLRTTTTTSTTDFIGKFFSV